MSNFLRGLEPQIERVCKKNGISLEHGRIIIHNYFKSLRAFLDDPRVPTVFLPWGKFRFSTYKMTGALARIAAFKRKGAFIPELTENKKKIWKLLLRREQEESCKIPTYMKWKTVKMRDTMQELFDNVDRSRKQHKNKYFAKWRAEKTKREREKHGNTKESETKLSKTADKESSNVAQSYTEQPQRVNGPIR